MSRRKPRRFSAIVAVVLLIIAAGWAAAFFVRRPRPTPELEGLELARRLGCLGCHGPGGTGGVPNPGSEDEQVPSWDGGTAMMYVENEDEIREWILYGEPRRLAEKHERHGHGEEPLLEMPAYGATVSEWEVDNLVAYFKAVAAYEKPTGEAREGYDVAKRLGCFGCHGPGGLVGTKNPRSFKGYIPPWRGGDYRELVRNDDELREWILDGHIDRLESNPLARFFTRRQIIEMPAYRSRITEGELDALVAYVAWLQET